MLWMGLAGGGRESTTAGQALGMTGFGILLAFLGLVFAADLFGTAERYVRMSMRVVDSVHPVPPLRWLPQVRRDKRIRVARLVTRLAGWSFLLIGLAVAVMGIVTLIEVSD